MTTQEIETILGVPNSTLSDWSNGSRREKLAKLLRAIDITTVEHLIYKHEQKPKISPKTQNIKLNKKLFNKDLLWSRENGSVMSIKNIISIYLNTPNQDDIKTLLNQFGEKRVLNVLHKNRPYMHSDDYTEANEQTQYAISSDTYTKTHLLPDIKEIIKNPKQRYIEILTKKYSNEKILEIAQSENISYPMMFQLKKILGKSA